MVYLKHLPDFASSVNEGVVEGGGTAEMLAVVVVKVACENSKIQNINYYTI